MLLRNEPLGTAWMTPLRSLHRAPQPRGVSSTLDPHPGMGTAQPPPQQPPQHRVPSALARGCKWLLPLSPTPSPCHPHPPPRSIYLKAAGRGGVATAPSPAAEPLRAACPPCPVPQRAPLPATPGAGPGAAPPLHRDPNKSFQHPKRSGGPKPSPLCGEGGGVGGELRVPSGAGDGAGNEPSVGASCPGGACWGQRGARGGGVVRGGGGVRGAR